MTSYAQRTIAAHAHEKTVAGKLRCRGWQVQEMGMGTLPSVMRSHLISVRDSYGHPCLLRWIPDYLATTDRFGKPQAFFVDGKNTQIESTNYAIELNAIETYKAIEQTFFIPVVMLAEGDKVITVHIATNRGCVKMDGRNTSGSGTSFMLVSKLFALGIDEIFGPEIRLVDASGDAVLDILDEWEDP